MKKVVTRLVNVTSNDYTGYIKEVDNFFLLSHRVINKLFLVLFVVTNIRNTIPEVIPTTVSQTFSYYSVAELKTRVCRDGLICQWATEGSISVMLYRKVFDLQDDNDQISYS